MHHRPFAVLVLALCFLLAPDRPGEIGAQPQRQSEAAPAVSPYAYLFPPHFTHAVEHLQRCGVEVEELREDIELDVEAYRVAKAALAGRRKETRRITAGTVLVRTGQPLGTLAASLLEPRSDGRLGMSNFFGVGLKEGQDHPVLCLPARVPMTLGKARPLPENRGAKKRITPAMLDNDTLPNFTGDPVSDLVWLEDGEHFLQTKEGQLLKVHATSGRSSVVDGGWWMVDGANKAVPFFTIHHPPSTIHHGARGGPQQGGDPPPQHKGPRELVSDSPTKKARAFVRAGDLYVEDAAKKERRLTADGAELIRNGKADWVYFEEVFDRKWKAYWWSPAGTQLAFLRTDDNGVPKATVLDHTRIRPLVEITPYPRAGDPNPQVRLGIAPIADGPVRWADLSGYAKQPFLITSVGWLPDSKTVYFCVQDRAQTWLDFCTVGREGGSPTRLFRETTRAWVNVPAAPLFLQDGSFLLTSERSGWKHLYHFAKDGRVKGPVTQGEWEVRSVQRVDEQAGWVYFSGTRDKHTAVAFYRIKLDGSGIEKLTKGKGTADVLLSPKGNLFVATESDPETPPQVRLYRTDGTVVRTIDSNPVYVREEFQLGTSGRVQIRTPDGFLLEASVHKPANFDPKKKYPVWFMTYGGPQMPMIRDGFGGGKPRDEALANAGYIVFRCDPRSASGKGAVSAWTAYRQLGVQELKDIETAITWLTAHPWVDAKRVGMSGHSYGGFMTSYALTHSKLFAAGVAGAPVTDWHNYDSIYTERYMNTPQENPQGYEVTSVVRAAKNLHGKLLLAHGVKDDNVHVQNTLQLVHALQQANKDFEVMLYPLGRHGFGGVHYQRLTREFMKRALQPQP